MYVWRTLCFACYTKRRTIYSQGSFAHHDHYPGTTQYYHVGFLYKDHSPAGTTTVLWNIFLMGIPSRDPSTTSPDMENNGLLRKSQINKEKKILKKSNWIELWATREQYWIVTKLNCPAPTLWKFISFSFETLITTMHSGFWMWLLALHSQYTRHTAQI